MQGTVRPLTKYLVIASWPVAPKSRWDRRNNYKAFWINAALALVPSRPRRCAGAPSEKLRAFSTRRGSWYGPDGQRARVVRARSGGVGREFHRDQPDRVRVRV